ncbi:cyclin-domain-containing protein [Myxozyma melibiosi]|uniref:Cyclin-domain-containing protein n=1 Tax=Myxozyma melibiosi TaxID=54550 RepID=A0ABR1F014_9ASCO
MTADLSLLLSPAPSLSSSSHSTVPSSRSPSPSPDDSFASMAANIACLLWFSPTHLLTSSLALARSSSPSHSPSRRCSLSPVCIPSPEFKSFAAAILARTQVSNTVVAFALLYIFRLKLCSPAIVGTPGSEYRVFTIALVLANKFLDDNTYTNKTWAQVSKLPVNEIAVMEVEFLRHVRYSLAVSKQKYDDWGSTLACFINLRKSARFACLSVPSSPVSVVPSLQQQFFPLPPHRHQRLPPPILPSSAATAAADLPISHKRKSPLDNDLFSLSPISPSSKRFAPDALRQPPSQRRRLSATSYYISPTTPVCSSDINLNLNFNPTPPLFDNSMATIFPPLLPKPQQFLPPQPPLSLPAMTPIPTPLRHHSISSYRQPPPPPPPPPHRPLLAENTYAQQPMTRVPPPPPHRPLLAENTYAQQPMTRVNPFVYPVVDKFYVPIPRLVAARNQFLVPPPPPPPSLPSHSQQTYVYPPL